MTISKCNNSLSTQVLREHVDFAGKNPPREVESTVPTFRVVRQMEKKTVLILDISGSMGTDRLAKLNQVFFI